MNDLQTLDLQQFLLSKPKKSQTKIMAHALFGNLEETRIPLNVHWGIYARQSSLIQLINNIESTEMQTEDLGKWLRLRNVPENQITLFDADLGASGRLAIHERQGLFDLVMSIYEGRIKAVLVYNVSRLFRDLSGIQYAVFAELCRQNDCVVVTAQDGMVYDFNQYIYVTLFHMQCRSAAEFLEQQVKLLQDARIKKSFRGEYASLGPIPTGFLVDNREESLYFEKFMLYEPHAEKVFSLLERYYSLEGNFSYLIRELDTQIAKGIPIFPAFTSWVDKRIANDKRWKRRELPCDGYGITPKGLERMFCNLAYLGIWVKPNGELIHNNHPRIVDADYEYLFWYAFERNSKVLLDGQPNEKREELKGATRYYQTHTKDPYGLLKDDKLEPANGDGFIYVHHYQGRWIYSNVPNPHQLHKTNIKSVPTHLVDDAFTSVFFERLKESRDFDEYRQWVGKERKRQKDTKDLIAIQLSTIAEKQAAIMDEILDIQTEVKQGNMTAEEAEPMKQYHRQKFSILEAEKKKLESAVQENAPNETMQVVQQLADFQTELAKLIPVWKQKPFNERKDFVNSLVKKVLIDFAAPHWITLEIIWKHPAWGEDTLFVFRRCGLSPYWTDEELAIIQSQYATTSRRELLRLLPSKTWDAIKYQGRAAGIRREREEQCEIPRRLTWNDWHFMQENNLSLSQDVQSSNDETLSFRDRQKSYT